MSRLTVYCVVVHRPSDCGRIKPVEDGTLALTQSKAHLVLEHIDVVDVADEVVTVNALVL